MSAEKAARFEYIVRQGGGHYVGMMGNLVLFNSPTTGSTLALKESDLTSDAVRKQITESNLKFGWPK